MDTLNDEPLQQPNINVFVNIMMRSQVLISVLFLLLPRSNLGAVMGEENLETVGAHSPIHLLITAAADSFPEVHGVGGHPVTLPCTYPVSNGLSSMCWGRGACASDTCGQTLIWTDGYRISYRTNNRYQLKGQLLQGDVSLTIENATQSDRGLYCCRVEMTGWKGVQTLTTSLQVQPVYTDTVTSSHRPWNNHTEVVPTPSPLKIPTKGLYIGISVSVVLLLLMSILIIIKYRHMRKKRKSEVSVVFHAYQNETFQSTVQPQAEDKFDIINDSFHSKIKS
ncbi:hepatitis A virus cellular receptor 1 homolog [Onychomys torridus]|uniref:hepatitis A virus cellular receptor 1 homolog n=1 Tax=Onychomys torridus TaxID=38674 RepID=UPI00167FC64C|nr:hepatitis A virus cellular receptor 1 homolog [Onychomys torridus]